MNSAPQPDWSRWAVVAYNDDTGLGRMANDLVRMLNLGHHLVARSERLATKPLQAGRDWALDPKADTTELRRHLDGLQGIISLERCDWHPQLFPTARAMGVRTVCVPMWEWFRGDDLLWKDCDLFVCPNEFSRQIVQSYGWRKTTVLPWLLDLNQLPVRSVRGPARVFVHNAGLVDHDDRKGTRDTIEAFMRVPRPELRLIVRAQKESPLPNGDPRIEYRFGNLAHPADLYAEGDVMIQPSKMEGLGFMVLEPVCCGLPVITMDYPPMNEIVRQPELRVFPRWFKRRCFANQWIKHAHLRLPRVDHLRQIIDWCADHDMEEYSTGNRQWAEATFSALPLIDRWNDTLGSLLQA